MYLNSVPKPRKDNCFLQHSKRCQSLLDPSLIVSDLHINSNSAASLLTPFEPLLLKCCKLYITKGPGRLKCSLLAVHHFNFKHVPCLSSVLLRLQFARVNCWSVLLAYDSIYHIRRCAGEWAAGNMMGPAVLLFSSCEGHWCDRGWWSLVCFFVGKACCCWKLAAQVLSVKQSQFCSPRPLRRMGWSSRNGFMSLARCWKVSSGKL